MSTGTFLRHVITICSAIRLALLCHAETDTVDLTRVQCCCLPLPVNITLWDLSTDTTIFHICYHLFSNWIAIAMRPSDGWCWLVQSAVLLFACGCHQLPFRCSPHSITHSGLAIGMCPGLGWEILGPHTHSFGHRRDNRPDTCSRQMALGEPFFFGSTLDRTDLVSVCVCFCMCLAVFSFLSCVIHTQSKLQETH